MHYTPSPSRSRRSVKSREFGSRLITLARELSELLSCALVGDVSNVQNDGGDGVAKVVVVAGPKFAQNV